MTNQDELASAIRDAVTEGSYVMPWDRLREWEKQTWRNRVPAIRAAVLAAEHAPLSPHSARAIVSALARAAERAAS